MRTRVRTGAGRSGGGGDLAAGKKAASEPRTRRAEGGERTHHGGKTRDQVREVGPCCGAWAAARGGCRDDPQTRTPGKKPGGRTPGSLKGSGPGPQA